MIELPRSPISRLAPTPNGELHWGNLLNFALTWAIVRTRNGKLWLRFDDIDVDRCKPLFADHTREILDYLGISWDDEYSNQFFRRDDYRHSLEKFPQYVCLCSRQEIFLRAGGHHYDGYCRSKKHTFVPHASAIRFLSPKSPAHDFILWRREDLPSYHLTCVHDEELMGINLIVRGEDLRESTEVQREISRSLVSDPFGSIAVFHHSLILGADGQKLSKSRSDGDLLQLIRSGKAPEEIWAMLGHQWGVNDVSSSQEFLTLLPRLMILAGLN
jgi:glutamyl/glutaminyl-tRNA synthetase